MNPYLAKKNKRHKMTNAWIFNSHTDEDADADKYSSSTSSSSSSSSSLIGLDSDVTESSSSATGEESEVQSVYKANINLTNALEEALPVRRSISKFYNGRSKSYACLADASIKNNAKPDNPYIRKRRNLLAFKLNHDKKEISKESAGYKPSALARGVALSRSESVDSTISNPTFLRRKSVPSPPDLRSRASCNNLASLSVPSSSQLGSFPSKRSASLPDIPTYASVDKWTK